MANAGKAILSIPDFARGPDGANAIKVPNDAGHGILVGGSSSRAMDAAALGVGLAGMRERMRQLRGELRVLTGARGTCVQARLALSSRGGASTEQFASPQRS